jgi:myo-inositol-1(or 4)-monophosphatase
MTPRRSAEVTLMVRAASNAARLLLRDFGEVEALQVSRKGPGDFVTKADRRTERMIAEELHKARPEFGFLLEESGAIEGKDKDRRWIIDPLDGTTNFLHGLGHWAISIALEEEGEITHAVTFDPVKDEMFTAERGRGAFLNTKRIRVSGRQSLDSALIGCGLPVQNWPARERGFADELDAVADHCIGLRRLGTASLDLAYIATGRMDGFWEYNLKPWDYAAGILMVREAGGRIERLEGGDDIFETGTIVAGTQGVQAELCKTLDQVRSGIASAKTDSAEPSN